MEERGLKITRNMTEYLACSEHQDEEIHSLGETGIDVGVGWKTGCGSHPQIAERIEKSVSVVRQKIT